MLDKIIKSIFVVDECRGYYDISFSVYENDFTIHGYNKNKICDELSMEGANISLENLDDMFFAIDGQFRSLRDIIHMIEGKIEIEIEEYELEQEAEYQEDLAMYKELSSPEYTGRI